MPRRQSPWLVVGRHNGQTHRRAWRMLLPKDPQEKVLDKCAANSQRQGTEGSDHLWQGEGRAEDHLEFRAGNADPKANGRRQNAGQLELGDDDPKEVLDNHQTRQQRMAIIILFWKAHRKNQCGAGGEGCHRGKGGWCGKRGD